VVYFSFRSQSRWRDRNRFSLFSSPKNGGNINFYIIIKLLYQNTCPNPNSNPPIRSLSHPYSNLSWPKKGTVNFTPAPKE